MNPKEIYLQLLAMLLTNYRKGRARPDIDRSRLGQLRIALMKLDGIGDFVLATGFLNTLRQALPQAEVMLFCRKPAGEIARQQFPYWTIVEIPYMQGVIQDILRDKATRRLLKNQKPFDLLLDLRTYRNLVEPVMASWIPARQKFALKNPRQPDQQGLRLPLEHRVYDQLLPLAATPEPGVAQDIQGHRTLAKWLLPQVPSAAQALPQLAVETAAREKMTGLIESRYQLMPGKPFLLVCPGTSSPRKEYPVPALAEAILAVMADHPMPVVIAGSKFDQRTTRPLHDLLRERCQAVDISEVFGLAEHLALMSLARAVLTMDTCHAHFAGALGRPAVVILGGAHYGMCAPWGQSSTYRWLTHQVPCLGCNWACIYDRPICIQDLPACVIANNLVEVLNLSEGKG